MTLVTSPRPPTTPYVPFSAYGVSVSSDLRRFPFISARHSRLLLSASSPLSFGQPPQTSPGKNDNLHLAAVSSTVWDSGSIGLLLVSRSRPSQFSLI